MVRGFCRLITATTMYRYCLGKAARSRSSIPRSRLKVRQDWQSAAGMFRYQPLPWTHPQAARTDTNETPGAPAFLVWSRNHRVFRITRHAKLGNVEAFFFHFRSHAHAFHFVD